MQFLHKLFDKGIRKCSFTRQCYIYIGDTYERRNPRLS